MQALEGVEVLELGLGAQARLAAAAQAHVAVAAHGALLHRAVGDAERQEHATQLLHEQARLLRCAEVGLGHKLDERRAAAVVVDEALGGRGDAALLAAHVDHLGGILLHMDAQDADGHGIGAVVGTHRHGEVRRVIGPLAGRLGARHRGAALRHVLAHGRGEPHRVGGGTREALGLCLAKRAVRSLLGAAAGDLEVQVTMHAEGHRTLRGLEVLGHVGIEVVLAVEHAVPHDLAIRGEAGLHDGLNRPAVGHRKGARQA